MTSRRPFLLLRISFPGKTYVYTIASRLPYVIIRGDVVPVKPDAGLSSQHSAVKDLKGVIQTFKLIEHKKHFSRSGFW